MTTGVVAAELVMKMAVDYAGMKADMDKVAQAVGASGEQMTKAMNVAKTALIGFLGVASVNAMKDLVLGNIEAVGSYNDLAASAAISADQLMAIAKVASFSGVSAETVAASMNKMNLELTKTGPNGSGAAVALKAIGLNYNDFMKLQPDERMMAVAKAMDGFKDGTEKSAVTALLFKDKTGQLVPVLKDLAAVGELHAKATKEQIEMADNFSDDLTRLKGAGEAWKTQLSMGMLPALNDAVGAMLQASKETGGWNDQIKALSKDGTIERWTATVITGLTYIMDAGSGVIRLFQSVGSYIAGEAAKTVTIFTAMANAVEQAIKGNFSGAFDTLKQGIRDVSSISEQMAEDQIKIWSEPTVGMKMRERIQATHDLRIANEGNNDETKKAVPLTHEQIEAAEKAKEAAKKHADEVEKVAKATREFIAATQEKLITSQQELDQGQKLTEGQKMILDMEKQIRAGKIDLTAKQIEAVKATAAQVDENNKLAEAYRKATEENRKSIEKINEFTEKLREQTKASKEKDLATYAALDAMGRFRNAQGKAANEASELKDLLHTAAGQQLADIKEVSAIQHAADMLAKADTAERMAKVFEASGMDREAIDVLRNKAQALRESASQEITSAIAAQTATIAEQTNKIREQAETYGMTERELNQYHIAQLTRAADAALEKADIAERTGLSADLVQAYRDSAKAMQEQAEEVKKGELVKAAKDVQLAWTKTAEDIASSLSQSFMDSVTQGKSIFEGFRDTLKRMFESTVLKVVVQPMMQQGVNSVMGMLGMDTSNAGQQNGGGLNLFQSLGNLFSGGSGGGTSTGFMSSMGAAFSQFGQGLQGGAYMANGGLASSWASLQGAGSAMGNGAFAGGLGQAAGTLGTAGAGLLAGHYIGNGISGGYSIGNHGQAIVNIGAAIGAIWGPLGSALGGAIGGLLNRAFGMGDKETREKGIAGTLGGSAGLTNGNNWVNWHQDGGWFRGDRDGTDWSKMDKTLYGAMESGAKAILEQSEAWAKALNLPADQLANITSSFKIQLSGKADEDQKAITKLFDDYQTALLAGYRGVLAPLMHEGETIQNAMARLIQLQAFSEQINVLGGVFSNIATASVSARENMIGLAGGIDKLIASSQKFVADYYTESEQMGLAAKSALETLKGLGIDGSKLGSREDYRALVESLGNNLNDETAQKQLVALLQLGPQFASLADWLKKNNETLGQAVTQAPQTSILDKLLPQQKDTTTAVGDVEAAVKASNERLDRLIAATKDGNISIATGLGLIAKAQADLAAAQAAAAQAQQNTNQIITTTVNNGGGSQNNGGGSGGIGGIIDTSGGGGIVDKWIRDVGGMVPI